MSILMPSVQSLFLQFQVSGTVLATATGFTAISPAGPILLTNRHNVTGRHNSTNALLSPSGAVPNEVVILHNKKDRLGEWIPRLEPLFSHDKHLWIEHPTFGTNADFVALRLTKLGDVQLYPYSLGQAAVPIKVSPSDILSVVGFPFGRTGGGALAIWATGFMATELDIDYEGMPRFLIDCRARPGQSGSAVIAHRNGGTVTLDNGSTAIYTSPVSRFLGIYSGRINEQSDLGVVWKASAITQLTESIT